MNFDDFTHQMTQKYRLAVAIAVLKEKPENLTIAEYLHNLQRNLTEVEMECDSDMTICSDDFKFDDDNANEINNHTKNVTNKDIENINEVDRNEIEETVDQIPNAESSITILNDLDLGQFVNIDQIYTDDKNEMKTSTVSNIVKIFKDVDGSIDRNKVDNLSKSNLDTQSTFYESLQSQSILAYVNAIEYTCETNTQDIATQNDPPVQNYIATHTLLDTIESNSSFIPVRSEKSRHINVFNSQETCSYTDISQSQIENVSIPSNYLFNKNKENILKDTTNLRKNEMNELSDVEKKYEGIQNYFKDKVDVLSNETAKEDIISRKNQNEASYNKEYLLFQEVNENWQSVDSQMQTFSSTSLNKKDNDILKDNLVLPNFSENYERLEREIPNSISTIHYNDIVDNIQLDDVVNSQTEAVSFKVLKELNKVKTYLNKNNRKATCDGSDPGYKSDSQSRGSFKSCLYSSDMWINQSAHCLFSYLTSFPMKVTTAVITNEISRVLGRLIDRLHDEEKYPQFLEEVLQTIESLLRDIYEGDSCVENVIISKDDKINRLYLLNRSIHIVDYTIEKITQILEKLYSKITLEDAEFEITNTVQMENLYYLFHILEHLLKRRKLTKGSSQDNSQASQDDGVLRKSSLTDIWRKKWDPNYKSNVPQVIVEKKCVLNKCSEILNKIIVQAMNGYSLISFAALQCFNILQS